jgi:hypothetical protein
MIQMLASSLLQNDPSLGSSYTFYELTIMRSFLEYINKEYLRRISHDLKLLTRGTKKAQVQFLICGAQKGGTTTLDGYLREHPEICMAKFKEVHFFDREKYFRYHKPDYHVYHNFFEPEGGQHIWGETTPVYMYWSDAPRRIWEYNPEMKLILLLRNPIKRAYSHWNMQRERGYDELPFLEAIQQEESRRRESLPYQNRRFSYLDRGFYSDQIKRLRAYFPLDQILILKSKTLRTQPQRALDQITHFLDIAPFDDIKPLDLHSRDYETPLDQETYNLLQEIYQNEISELERITGWDCQEWRS